MQTTRVSVVPQASVPGSGTYKPTGPALRVELRRYETASGLADGDVTNTGGYLASRAEVFDRLPNPTTLPPIQWPDPIGSTRWYEWSLFVPVGHAVDTTGLVWFTCTQWKGLTGNSPPVSIEIKNSFLRLGGTRTNRGLVPNDGNLGAISFGSWTKLKVGILHHPDPAVGWIEVWRDDVQVQSRLPLSTMDYQADGTTPDPTYLKQGIYRDIRWAVTHVLHFGPLTIR